MEDINPSSVDGQSLILHCFSSQSHLKEAKIFWRHHTQIAVILRTKQSAPISPPLYSKLGGLFIAFAVSTSYGTTLCRGDMRRKASFSPLMHGAKKIIFTACYLGKLKLTFTSPNIISTSPKNVLMSRIDFAVLFSWIPLITSLHRRAS